MGKPKASGDPKTLGDVEPGWIAQTPCGHLLVMGQVKGGTLVELWHPYEQRKCSATFGVMAELVVLAVTRRPGAMPPAAGGAGTEVDPVRG